MMIDIKDLFPNFSEEELADAEQRLRAYIEVVDRIALRQARELDETDSDP